MGAFPTPRLHVCKSIFLKNEYRKHVVLILQVGNVPWWAVSTRRFRRHPVHNRCPCLQVPCGVFTCLCACVCVPIWVRVHAWMFVCWCGYLRYMCNRRVSMSQIEFIKKNGNHLFWKGAFYHNQSTIGIIGLPVYISSNYTGCRSAAGLRSKLRYLCTNFVKRINYLTRLNSLATTCQRNSCLNLAFD